MQRIILVIAVLLSLGVQADTTSFDPGAKSESNIEYETPEEAWLSLNQAGVSFTNLNNGILIGETGEGADFQLWIFTEESHSVHPTVLKYEIRRSSPEENYIQLSSLCFGEEQACAEIYNHYEAFFNKDDE
jgi:hypothetical protein